MHNPRISAAPLDDYQWPTCAACARDLWADETHRLVCRPCEDRASTRLGELPGLFARLDTTSALVRGARRTSSTPTGGQVAPLPLKLAVLDLAAVGGVASRLQAIEDSWRAALGRRVAAWAGAPRQAVPVHVEFLRINLQWACENYGEVGQDLEDIRRLHGEATAALSGEVRPGRVKVGRCPVLLDDRRPCDEQLTASAATHRIRCPHCGTRWNDMNAWQELRRAQEARLRANAGVAA